MHIAVLVFGQFRSAKELLDTNLRNIKQFLPKATFDVYILTDKLQSGNYSKDMEFFVRHIFETHNFTIRMLEFWESFEECHAYEEVLASHLHDISKASLGKREQWATSLWYRRYIMWKLFEDKGKDKGPYDYVIFTRIFDTSILCLNPLTLLLQEKPDADAEDTLFFCIDTFFIGTPHIMKQLFKFGASAENWKAFEWTPEFTEAFAKFDLCLSQTKPPFSSESQIFHYIHTHLSHYKNIRYDFSSPNTQQNEAYLCVKIERVNIIPKRILQIAIGDIYLSSLPLQRIKEIITAPFNTDHEYILLTDATCQIFLTKFFPQFYELYCQLERPQYKSDLVRYLYLYKYGGYYIDIDIVPLLPLYTIFELTQNSSAFFAIGAHTDSTKGTLEICNGFIGTKKDNPLFLDLATAMKEEPNPTDYGANVKRLYKALAAKQPIVPFQPHQLTYFFREVQHQDKYYIVNHKEIIALSNGHTTIA